MIPKVSYNNNPKSINFGESVVLGGPIVKRAPTPKDVGTTIEKISIWSGLPNRLAWYYTGSALFNLPDNLKNLGWAGICKALHIRNK